MIIIYIIIINIIYIHNVICVHFQIYEKLDFLPRNQKQFHALSFKWNFVFI